MALTRSACALLDATFVPIAGMVGASLRDGGEELLGRGLGLQCYAAGGPTMGIPLLHPWANRLASDDYRINGGARDPHGHVAARRRSSRPAGHAHVRRRLRRRPRWR
jgi:hypothetical protein